MASEDYKKFMAEWNAEQQRLENERLRPVREAEQQLQQTATQLGIVERDLVLNSKDPEWALPESAVGLKMTRAEARKFAASEAERFVAETPDYFPSKKNQDILTEYLLRQGLSIPNVDCFKQAFQRLRSFSLLEERPAQEPEPIVEEQPTEQELSVPQEPESFQGWDVETGEPRTYKKREVAAMSADFYKRAFRLYGDRAPRLIRAQ
jgi:hypothetical protein